MLCWPALRQETKISHPKFRFFNIGTDYLSKAGIVLFSLSIFLWKKHKHFVFVSVLNVQELKICLSLTKLIKREKVAYNFIKLSEFSFLIYIEKDQALMNMKI